MSTTDPKLMDKIISLAKQRGFVFPGSEIYGGLANTWDYGPLGAQLRMNIKKLWWQDVVERRPDMVGLDGAILMNPKVWEASGHVTTFHDPLVEDVVTHKRYRADHLLEKALDTTMAGKSLEDMAKLIVDNNILSPDGNELTPPKQFNLMFSTKIGPVSDSGTDVYMRPETAQAIFVNFRNVLQSSRQRLPFGIAQIGKAFRNEITPGNFIFRTLEFEQMEIEYFVEEGEWETKFEEWQKWMQEWAVKIGIDTEKLHADDIPENDLAHYSKRTIDFDFEFPFGKDELWGLAYRTNYDLSQHQEHSGEKLVYTDPQDPKNKFIPHVIEPSMGVDRTMLAVLVSAYDEETVNDNTRVVMRLPHIIAPYQVAILPLQKKLELQDVAKKLYTILGGKYRTEYDETQSIGKRYRRQDEIGTPYCITIDFESLKDNAVTIRERDSMKQERIAIDDVVNYLEKTLQ